ncbi:MAG: DUF4388 domain-containing protein [Acidobacteriota bacterium]|nr:DUF4388 domain-containing protein [Acidobacteriota bacterium]
MAIEGDLRDLSLTSLVQVLCLERRRALLQLRRRGEEGFIFLADGEIVHCALGRLEGEAAAYHLLAWGDGLFRVTSDHGEVPRTIGKNLNYLLLESTRILDERQRAGGKSEPPVERGPSKVEEEFDRAFEASLSTLIAEIEELAADLTTQRIHRRPVRSLSVFAAIVNRAVEFSESIPGSDPSSSSLVKALGRQANKYPQVRLLYVKNNRVSVQTAVNLYAAWADDSADRGHMFRQLGRGTLAIAEDYFSLFATYLSSPARRELWTETSKVFVLNLGRTLEALNL